VRQVIGIGETILDILFLENQPQFAVPGGSVFNGLVSLSRLGIPVSFISEIGQDYVGRLIADFMRTNSMTTDYMDFFPNGKSPVSLAFLDEQKNAAYQFYTDYPNQRLNFVLPPINQDDIVVLGSYFALNPLFRERVVELLDYAKERKAIVYYDLNFRKPHANQAILLLPTVMDNYEYATIVRGSDEDFFNLYKKTEAETVYREHVSFYCKRLITTHGAEGANLFTGTLKKYYGIPNIVTPVSTVGAGDNFNAGIVYGLIKYNIGYNDVPGLSEFTWDKIIRCGMDFSAEVCRSYSNYLSPEFAAKYQTL